MSELSAIAPTFREVRLSAEARRTILDHGRESYPEEACGLLLGPTPRPRELVREVDEALRAANRKQEDRTHRFLIPADELKAVERRLEGTGREVVGFYHSHPDHPGRPSEFDRDHAWPWYAYLVLAVAHGAPGELGVFELDPEERVFQDRRLGRGERDAEAQGR